MHKILIFTFIFLPTICLAQDGVGKGKLDKEAPQSAWKANKGH